MKLIIFLLFFFIIFWYYRKRRLSRKGKSSALEVEMRACHNCGIFFSSPHPHMVNEESKTYFFCSEQCFKEFQAKRKGQ